jgi:hypothetical protein
MKSMIVNNNHRFGYFRRMMTPSKIDVKPDALAICPEQYKMAYRST